MASFTIIQMRPLLQLESWAPGGCLLFQRAALWGESLEYSFVEATNQTKLASIRRRK
jgi:hypothetical protein